MLDFEPRPATSSGSKNVLNGLKGRFRAFLSPSLFRHAALCRSYNFLAVRVLDFAKELIWYPPYPIRKPLLWFRKRFESPYERWLKQVYPCYCAERFEFENRALPPDAPRISLITLVFQPRPSHFQKCAESVLAQTNPNFEWVIVNNSSGSTRVQKLLNVLSAHPGIKVLTPEQNLGIAKGTSLAAQKATGSWLAFLDHDDILDPKTLMDVAKVALFRPDIEFIYSDSDHCDEVGRRHTPLLKAGPSPEYILGTNYICHFHAIRKTLFQKIHRGVSKLDGSQDWEISLKALDNPHRVYHCPKILYTQRVHPNQFSSHFYRTKNSRAKEQISRSQREILESYLMRRGLGMSYEIKELPARGCYYIRYAGKKEPAVTVLVPIRPTKPERRFDPLKQRTDYHHYVLKPLDPGENFAGALTGVTTPYVAWCDPGIKIETPQWLSQSIGLMERESGVAFVSGKILGLGQVFPHPNPKVLPPGVSFGADLRREVTHPTPHWWVGRTEVCKTTQWIVESKHPRINKYNNFAGAFDGWLRCGSYEYQGYTGVAAPRQSPKSPRESCYTYLCADAKPHPAMMHGLRVVYDPTLLGVWNG